MEDIGFSMALFVHIVGALGFFVALGLEWSGLSQLQGATPPEHAEAWMDVLGRSRRLGFGSMFLAVITGFYMMATDVGAVPWLIVTLGSVVLLIVLAAALTGPRMAAIGRTFTAQKTTPSDAFRRLANHPILGLSIRVRTAVALGIVFLKVVQPDLVPSLLTIGVAILLGLASALPIARVIRARGAETN